MRQHQPTGDNVKVLRTLGYLMLMVMALFIAYNKLARIPQVENRG
jgi:hypothetical protein